MPSPLNHSFIHHPPAARSKSLTHTPIHTHTPGDVFDEKSWAEALHCAVGVVSCIGAFGSNAFMERINGDANVHAAEVAAKAGGWVYRSYVWSLLLRFVCFTLSKARETLKPLRRIYHHE